MSAVRTASNIISHALDIHCLSNLPIIRRDCSLAGDDDRWSGQGRWPVDRTDDRCGRDTGPEFGRRRCLVGCRWTCMVHINKVQIVSWIRSKIPKKRWFTLSSTSTRGAWDEQCSVSASYIQVYIYKTRGSDEVLILHYRSQRNADSGFHSRNFFKVVIFRDGSSAEQCFFANANSWMVHGWLVHGWLVHGWLVHCWLVHGCSLELCAWPYIFKFVPYGVHKPRRENKWGRINSALHDSFIDALPKYSYSLQWVIFYSVWYSLSFAIAPEKWEDRQVHPGGVHSIFYTEPRKVYYL